MYRRAYREEMGPLSSAPPVRYQSNVTLPTLQAQNSFIVQGTSLIRQESMAGYENIYRKELQALNISRRSIEMSMVDYTERMREIAAKRGQMAAQPLMVKPQGGRKWTFMKKPNTRWDEYTQDVKPPWQAFAEKSKQVEQRALQESLNLGRPRVLLAVHGDKQGGYQSKSPPFYRRPISDTPLGQTRVYHDPMSTMSSPLSFARNPYHHIPTFSSETFLDRSRVRPGSTKILDLTDVPEYDPYSESEDYSREGVEITPFPDIEVQALPVVLHETRPTGKSKSRKNKRKKGKPDNGLRRGPTPRGKALPPLEFKPNYHFKYSRAVEETVIGEQDQKSETSSEKSPRPELHHMGQIDVDRLNKKKQDQRPVKPRPPQQPGMFVKKKPPITVLTDAMNVKGISPVNVKVNQENIKPVESKPPEAEVVPPKEMVSPPKPVLKPFAPSEIPAAKPPQKKSVQFGADMIREVTKITYPQSDSEDDENCDDEDDDNYDDDDNASDEAESNSVNSDYYVKSKQNEHNKGKSEALGDKVLPLSDSDDKLGKGGAGPDLTLHQTDKPGVGESSAVCTDGPALGKANNMVLQQV